MKPRDPRAVAGRARRHDRARASRRSRGAHFKPTEVMSSDYFRGPRRPTTRTTRPRPSDAFDVAPLRRRQAAGGRPPHRHRRHQRPARGPQAARRARAQYHVLPVAIVLDIPERTCEERNALAARPPVRPARPRVASARQLRRSLERSRQGGLPPRLRPARRRRSTRVGDRARSRSGTTARTSTARSTSSATSTAAATSSRRCSTSSATRSSSGATGTGLTAGPVYRHPDGRMAVFVGDLVDRGPRVLDTLRTRPQHGRWPSSALMRHGQPRAEAPARPPGRNVQITHGLAESLAEIEAVPADDRPALVEDAQGVARRPDQPLRARRRPARRRPRRAEGGDARPRLGRRPRVRAVRRHDRRDRRVRAAGAARLGGRLPRPGDGRLRPHAGARGRVAQQHDRHRHRLRLRRQAHRAALPGARARVGAGGANLLRAGPPVPRARGRRRLGSPPSRSTTTCSTSPTCSASGWSRRACAGRVTIREENAAAALEVDEPLRGRPALARLPAADDVADRDDGRGAGLLEHPAEAFAYYRTNGVPKVVVEEKHMGSRAVLVVCRDADAARTRFGVADGSAGIVYTRTGRRFFDDAALEAAVLEPRAGGRRRRRDCGTSSPPTGCSSMPS